MAVPLAPFGRCAALRRALPATVFARGQERKDSHLSQNALNTFFHARQRAIEAATC
ncbi:hypothetical protein Kim5_CH03965 [Rhizobium sp. Kim5]|nr:hypothetical protein Kim5_CH03965 [Rhizobium sp. Kim5]